MIRPLILLLCVTAIFADDAKLSSIAISDLKRAKPVDFATEIIPLFQKSCLACHNAGDAKGDLVLESPATILKGGETGPAVIPGKSAESILLMSASYQTKPVMPPRNNKADAKPLTSDELGLVKLWIDQGATGTVAVLPPLRWQNLAESFNPILASAISSDGQIAACARANHIDLYDIPSLQFSGSLTNVDRDVIESLAFSPDGQLLAAGGYRNVKLWKLETPSPRKVADIPQARLTAFSSDGKQIVLGMTNEIQIVGLDGKLIRSIPETNEVKAIALNAAQLAVAIGKQIQLRNLNDTNTTTFESPADVLALTFHPNQSLIESAADGIIRIWNPTNGQKIREISTPAQSLAISADGKRLAAAGGNIVRLMNFEDGKVIAELKGDRIAQENAAGAQRFVNFAKSETGFRKANVETAEKNQKTEAEALKKVTEAKAAADKTLTEKNEAAKKANEAKAAADKVLKDTIAAIAQATENKGLSEKLVATAESAAKSAAASAADANTIFERAKGNRNDAYANIIDLGAAAKTDAAKTAEAHAAIDRALIIKLSFEHAEKAKATADKAAADASGNAKAAVDNRGNAEKALADLTTQQKDYDTKFKAAEKAFADADAAVKAQEVVIRNVATNLEGTTAVAKKADEAVAETKKLFAEAEGVEKNAVAALEAANKKGAESEVKAVAIAFAGAWVAVSGEDSILRLFAADSGKPGPIRKLEKTAALGTDGSAISAVVGSQLMAVDLATQWKLERAIGDGSETSPLTDRVLSLNFSTDGKLLATGGGVASRGGELKLWNVADGALVREFKDAHSDSVYSVRFSPDQKLLASGAADKLMKVFEVSSGKFIRSFEGHTAHVLNVSWMRHGRTIASAGADSAIKVWDFVSGEQKKTIGGVSREITALQFLDGPAEALAASGDNQLRLLKEDGGVIRAFGGASDYTQTAAITPDGRVVVAGGNDSQFRVWDGVKGDLIKTFAAPERAGRIVAKQ